MYATAASRNKLLTEVNSLVGAYRSASTALCALIGVDRILVTSRDSAYRALVNTCSTCNAVIVNNVSHNVLVF